MICYVKPCKEDKDFLFVSYCHRDWAQVYPIIERLAAEGFYVWYDNGVYPGEEWPETIAQHMIEAKVCIAMVSPAAAESLHCRNELTFAVSNSMPILPVMLENFRIPLGMQLQLGNARYVRKYEETDEAFYAKLINSPVLAPYRSAEGADPKALERWKQHLEKYREAEEAEKSGKGKKNAPAGQAMMKAARQAVPDEDEQEEEEEEKTLLFDGDAGGEEQLKIGHKYHPALLLRVRTGEIFPIRSEKTVLGRSKIRADLAFPDNPEISGKHAEIWERGTGFILQNFNPTNATEVNGRVLPDNAVVELKPCSEILLADEQLFLLFGTAYENVFDEQKICLLRSRTTGEAKVLAEESLLLDRRHKWRGDVLGDQRIHRSGHAEIYRENGRLCIRDLGSRFGTFLNGRQLEPNVGAELHDKDVVAVVDTEFDYYEIKTWDKDPQTADNAQSRNSRSPEEKKPEPQ